MATPAETQWPPDATVRERALAVDHSFLVRAPAGSGKTELLVQRLLALLAVVDEPEAVLAVTFSRKAAAEMRARVLTALAAASGPEPSEPHVRRTWTLAAAAQAHARDRGWNLAITPARLRVLTLDALALSLAGRMPWLSRLGAPPQPAEDATPLYRTAARALFARLDAGGETAAALHTLLLRLDNNLEHAEELIAQLLASREQWLPLLADFGGGGDARSGLEQSFRDQLELDLAALAEVIAADPHAPPLPAARIEALSDWQTLADSVLTKAGTLHKRKKPAFVAGPDACRALHSIRSLQPLLLDDAAWARLADLVHLLPLAAAELQLVFRDQGACDFTECTLAALRALGDDSGPSALAFALDGRLQHLLVDEFQDTSAIQFALLQKLVADWQPGDGHTLFLVGDAMQSIYAFRHARVDLFLRAAAEGLGPIRLETIELTANFRSQGQLVHWFNATFGAVFPPDDDARRAQVGFHPAKPVHPASDPGVLPHPLIAHHPELEAVEVARVVEAERSANPQTSIAILVHNRRHAAALLPALAARGLHPQGVRLAPVAASAVAADLLAIAQAILDPADRVAWLALLRAPWCGLTLADLHALCRDDGDATVSELWSARRSQLSEEGQSRAAGVLATVQAAGAQRGRVPLRGLVAWCWQELGGPACAAARANAADAGTVLALLEQAERVPGGFEPAALQQQLAGLYTPPDPRADAKLQIMTVHQAKGLEFDVVILPSLARRPRRDDAGLLAWQECPAPAGSRAVSQFLLAAQAARGGDNRHAEFVRARRDRLRQQEQLRLLYVAATRARDRLHLFAALPPHPEHEPRPDARSPLARIWPATSEQFLALHRPFLQDPHRAASAIAAAHRTLDSPAPALRRVRSDWSPTLPHDLNWHAATLLAAPSAQLPVLHVAGALARRIGVAVHAMLQGLAGLEPLAWDHGRLDACLRQAGIAAADLPAARAQAAAALDRTLADSRGRWILAPHEDAQTEWGLTTIANGSLQHAIIDRSFVAEGVRWIIDYKLATHEGSALDSFLDQEQLRYQPQLDAYAAILRTLSSLPVCCGLYFPLLAAWRAW